MQPPFIVTADQRLSRPAKINIALFGPSGIGKTYQARTLDPVTTLFVDLEGGDLSLGDWAGDTLNVRKLATDMGVHPWLLCRALACVMCGPDPAATDPTSAYSQQSYDAYCAAFRDLSWLNKYSTIFWDSITVAARYSFEWSRTQPDAFSEKTGKPDTRGAYGLHGKEMVRWLTTIQHIPEKSTIVVGILNRTEDDLRRVSWVPQIDGSKAGQELPGIFDEVLTLTNFTDGEGKEYRALVTHQMNQWGFPAKDRSGCLDMVEPPNLGMLIAKIRAGQRKDTSPITTLPALPTANVQPQPAQQQPQQPQPQQPNRSNRSSSSNRRQPPNQFTKE